MAIERHWELGVWNDDGEVRLTVDGQDVDFELTAFQAGENLLRRMHREALAASPDHVRFRAVIGRSGGRGFLVAGPRRSGKTTLALGLLLAGCEVSGDELVLLRDGRAVAFPWRFIVNEPSVALLPPLRALPPVVARAGALARDWWFATDPTDFGRPWDIRPAAIESMFWLEPGHGSRSVVTEVGKLDMTRHLLSQTTAPPSGRADWLGDVTRLVEGTRTFRIEMGDVASTCVAVADRV
ncbi:MAG: hypothetical protein EPO10_17940 [Reyranella sp.]|uniref:hypothetical protein n=1 Tax=Reyranella sp. TaxID=1929291 RepID=UPI00120D1269|nr:hypothetical protein [Reyranella sp.]TAJ96761.1 MAG: hypothetical protein EPO41_05785 [Reyranella sp.]TBR27482.1 MAG: hypothetical protein EPO10_17940 [Reyranella sp.]